jgi:hypothetical protein
VPGFPIRTSSDPRSVDSSPRHNAASHVLHRLPVPRHPPCALKHLQHKTKSYKNFEIAHQHTQKTTTPKKGGDHHARQMLATTIHKSNTTPHHQSGATTKPTPERAVSPPVPPTTGRRGDGPVVSKPNSVSGNSLAAPRPLTKTSRGPACLSCTRTTPTTGVAHPQIRPRPGDPRYAGRLESRGAP